MYTRLTACSLLRRTTAWAVTKFDVRKKNCTRYRPSYHAKVLPTAHSCGKKKICIVCFAHAHHRVGTPRIRTISLKMAALVGGKVKTVGPCICQRHALKKAMTK